VGWSGGKYDWDEVRDLYEEVSGPEPDRLDVFIPVALGYADTVPADQQNVGGVSTVNGPFPKDDDARRSGPRDVEWGDGGAYAAQHTAVAERVMAAVAETVPEAAGIAWQLVYQSRPGPPTQPWLAPDGCDGTPTPPVTPTPAPSTPSDPAFKITLADRMGRLPMYLFARINTVLYQQRLAGEDVILIHRMMKNHVPSRNYVLITETARASANLDAGQWHSHIEALDGLGETHLWFSDAMRMPV